MFIELLLPSLITLSFIFLWLVGQSGFFWLTSRGDTYPPAFEWLYGWTQPLFLFVLLMTALYIGWRTMLTRRPFCSVTGKDMTFYKGLLVTKSFPVSEVQSLAVEFNNHEGINPIVILKSGGTKTIRMRHNTVTDTILAGFLKRHADLDVATTHRIQSPTKRPSLAMDNSSMVSIHRLRTSADPSPADETTVATVDELALQRRIRSQDVSGYLDKAWGYFLGQRTYTKDYSKAAKWARKAYYEGGYCIAAHILGELHWYGDGVDRDQGKALDFFSQSLPARFGRTYYFFGEAYLKGITVLQSDAKAKRWFLKAIAKDDCAGYLGLFELHRARGRRCAAFRNLMKFATHHSAQSEYQERPSIFDRR